MPNKENIQRVIDAIMDEDNYFNMADYQKYLDDLGPDGEFICASPSCICGWACYLDGAELQELHDNNRAANFLGITDYHEAYKLFYPPGNCSYRNITRLQAVQCLEELVLTGRVNWSRQLGETK